MGIGVHGNPGYGVYLRFVNPMVGYRCYDTLPMFAGFQPKCMKKLWMLKVWLKGVFIQNAWKCVWWVMRYWRPPVFLN